MTATRTGGILSIASAELAGTPVAGDLYQINLALRAANLEARLIDNGFSFRGSAKSGDGTLEANGKLTWREVESVLLGCEERCGEILWRWRGGGPFSSISRNSGSAFTQSAFWNSR